MIYPAIDAGWFRKDKEARALTSHWKRRFIKKTCLITDDHDVYIKTNSELIISRYRLINVMIRKCIGETFGIFIFTVST